MVRKIDHIAIAVHNLEEQLEFYTAILGLNCAAIEEVPEQQVRVAILPVGDTRIELLEPTSAESPIARFLAKRGEGLHHIAYQVINLEGELSRIEEQGVELIDRTPKTGAAGKKIAFLHPKSTHGVLIELCESLK